MNFWNGWGAESGRVILKLMNLETLLRKYNDIYKLKRLTWNSREQLFKAYIRIINKIKI